MIDVLDYGLLESTSDNPDAQLFAQHDAGLDMKPYLCAAHVDQAALHLFILL
jgi:hypothetical protein